MRCFLTIALLLSLVLPAQGTITRDGSAVYTNCTATPCSHAHTVAGADPMLGVCVTVWHYVSTQSIASVTWNGLPLTLVVQADNPSCGDRCRTALYVLANPAPGTANVSVSLGSAFSSGTGAFTIGSASFNGVDPVSPTANATSATGNSGSPSVTVASSSSAVVLDCLSMMAAGGAPSTASGQTTNWSASTGWTLTASGYATGVPSTVMQWSATASPWASVGVSLTPATGGGTTPPPPPGTQVILSWQDNSDNEQWFHLRWRTDQSYPNYVDVATQIPANSTSYIHDIGSQTGPCWQIQATNEGGASGFTNDVCLASPPPPPPPPPMGAAMSGGMMIEFEEDL